MKRVYVLGLAIALAVVASSCNTNSTDSTAAVDSTSVAVDSAAMVIDTAAVADTSVATADTNTAATTK